MRKRNKILSFILAATMVATNIAPSYTTAFAAEAVTEADTGWDNDVENYDDDGGYEDYDRGENVSTNQQSSQSTPQKTQKESQAQQTVQNVENTNMLTTNTFDIQNGSVFIYDDPNGTGYRVVEYAGNTYNNVDCNEFVFTGSTASNTINVMTNKEIDIRLKDLNMDSDVAITLYGSGKFNVYLDGIVSLNNKNTNIFLSGNCSTTLSFAKEAMLIAKGSIGATEDKVALTIENGLIDADAIFTGSDIVVKGGNITASLFNNPVSKGGRALYQVAIDDLESFATYVSYITVNDMEYDYGKITTNQDGAASLYLPEGDIEIAVGNNIYIGKNTDKGVYLSPYDGENPKNNDNQTEEDVKENEVELENVEIGVVTIDSIEIMDEPSFDGTALCELSEGEKVALLRYNSDGWYYILTEEDIEGYIYEEAVEIQQKEESETEAATEISTEETEAQTQAAETEETNAPDEEIELDEVIYGTVSVEFLDLMDEASFDGNSIYDLHQGDVVTISKYNSNGWYYVLTDNEISGYVQEDGIELLSEKPQEETETEITTEQTTESATEVETEAVTEKITESETETETETETEAVTEKETETETETESEIIDEINSQKLIKENTLVLNENDLQFNGNAVIGIDGENDLEHTDSVTAKYTIAMPEGVIIPNNLSANGNQIVGSDNEVYFEVLGNEANTADIKQVSSNNQNIEIEIQYNNVKENGIPDISVIGESFKVEDEGYIYAKAESGDDSVDLRIDNSVMKIDEEDEGNFRNKELTDAIDEKDVISESEARQILNTVNATVRMQEHSSSADESAINVTAEYTIDNDEEVVEIEDSMEVTSVALVLSAGSGYKGGYEYRGDIPTLYPEYTGVLVADRIVASNVIKNECTGGNSENYATINNGDDYEGPLRFSKAAFYKGEWLDVEFDFYGLNGKFLVRKDNGMKLHSVSGGSYWGVSDHTKMEIDMTFYKAGTNTPAEFKGLLMFTDLDMCPYDGSGSSQQVEAYGGNGEGWGIANENIYKPNNIIFTNTRAYKDKNLCYYYNRSGWTWIYSDYSSVSDHVRYFKNHTTDKSKSEEESYTDLGITNKNQAQNGGVLVHTVGGLVELRYDGMTTYTSKIGALSTVSYEEATLTINKQVTDPSNTRPNANSDSFPFTVSGTGYYIYDGNTVGQGYGPYTHTLTTGSMSIPELLTGTYTATELTSGSPKIADYWDATNTGGTVNLTAAGATITFQNRYKTGKIRVRKVVDMNGSLQSQGGTTNITQFSAQGYKGSLDSGVTLDSSATARAKYNNLTWTTGSDGTYTTGSLPISSTNLRVVETQTAAGLTGASIDAAWQVTRNPETVPVVYDSANHTDGLRESTITNKLRVADVKIQKTYIDRTDANYNENTGSHTAAHDNGLWHNSTSKNLAGFVFRIKGNPLANPSMTIEGTVTTAADGTATFKNIPYGNYTITEELTSAQAYIWHNTTKSISISINSGTVAKLASDQTKGTFNDASKVNAQGYVEYLNTLKTGHLEVTKQIEKAVDVTSNDSVTFTDQYNESAEKITTHNNDTTKRYNEDLSGFVFKLTGTSDAGLYEEVYAVTDTNGKATFNNILKGQSDNYTIIEVSGQDLSDAADAGNKSAKYLMKSWYVDQLDGHSALTQNKRPLQSIRQYMNPTSFSASILFDDNKADNDPQKQGQGQLTTYKTYKNTLLKWNITTKIRKTDGASYNDPQHLAEYVGAKYGLYDGDLNHKVAEFTTDANGEFTIRGPYVLGDNWFLQEISAPTGYLVSTTKYYIDATVDDVNCKTANEVTPVFITVHDVHGRNAGNTVDGTPIIKDYNDEKQINTLGEKVKKNTVPVHKSSYVQDNAQYDSLKSAGFTVYELSKIEEVYNINLKNRSDEWIVEWLNEHLRDDETETFDPVLERPLQPAVIYSEGAIGDVETYHEYYGHLANVVVNEVTDTNHHINPSNTPALVKTYNYYDPDHVHIKATVSIDEPAGEDTTTKYIAAEFFTNERGMAYMPMLPYGDYVMIETTTPYGYSATNPVVLHIRDDHNNGTSEVDGNGTIHGVRDIVDEDITAYVRIEKRAQNDNAVVKKPGAKYVIFTKRDETVPEEEDVDLDRYVKYLAQQSEIPREDEAAFIQAYKDAYMKDYGLLVVDPTTLMGTEEDPYTYHSTSGGIHDEYIVQTPQRLPMGTYYIMEVGAPNGYVLYGQEGKYRVDANGNTFWEAEDVSDTKWSEYHKTLGPDDQGAWDEDESMTQDTSKPIRFELTASSATKDPINNEYYMLFTWTDDPAVGKISIYNEGEQLVSVDHTGGKVSDRVADDFNGYTDAENNGYEAANFENIEFNYQYKPIKGATYDIIALDDIYSQNASTSDNDRVLLFEKDKVVTTLTTGEDGTAHTATINTKNGTYKGLPIGRYIVRQTNPGNGFYLSEQNKEDRIVEITYDGEDVPIVFRDEAYVNPRKEIEISIDKYDANTEEHVDGAIFGLYAATPIKNYAGEVVIAANELIALSETYHNGKAQFYTDATLPIGKYYIEEFAAPKGYTTSDARITLPSVTVYNQDVEEDKYEYKNVNFNDDYKFTNEKVKVHLRLADADTDVELNNGKFEIYDEDDNLVTVTVNGELTTEISTYYDSYDVIEGLEVGKKYYLKEKTAPYGYRNYMEYDNTVHSPYHNELVFTYEGQDYYGYDMTLGRKDDYISFTVRNQGKVQIINVKNRPIPVILTIRKEGEVATVTYDGVEEYTINYNMQGLEGASYRVIATSDVYHPDKHTNYPDPIVRSGDEIARITTNENGEYVFNIIQGMDAERLWLGSYEIEELAAPDGYVRFSEDDSNKQTVDFKNIYDSKTVEERQTLDNVEDSVRFENDRQLLDIGNSPKDPDPTHPLRDINAYLYGQTGVFKRGKAEGQNYPSDTNSPVVGAKFALYALHDIKNINGTVLFSGAEIDDDGNIVSDGTKIQEAITDENGQAKFRADLPIGDYYAKEIEAPEGYYLNTKPVYFLAEKYKTNNEVAVVRLQEDLEDDISVTKLFLRDWETNYELAGAKFNILDENDNIVVKNVSINGEDSTSIEGIITQNTSDGGHIIYGLNPGSTYKFVEVYPRDKYTTDIYDEADVNHGNVFEYTVPMDTHVNEVVLYNKYITEKLSVTKTGEILSGKADGNYTYESTTIGDVMFTLEALEPIMHPDGSDTLLYDVGDPVAEGVTNENGVAVLEPLMLGTYLLREATFPEGYRINQDPDHIAEVGTVAIPNYHDTSLILYQNNAPYVEAITTIDNERQKVRINVQKKDFENEDEFIGGGTYVLKPTYDIIDRSGLTIAYADEEIARITLPTKEEDPDNYGRGTFVNVTVTDEGEEKYFLDLPLGDYYVEEIKAPEGYSLPENPRVYIDCSYDSTGVKEITETCEFINEETKVALDVLDFATNTRLDTTKLLITGTDGYSHEYTIGSDVSEVLRGLRTDILYTVQEIAPKYGYGLEVFRKDLTSFTSEFVTTGFTDGDKRYPAVDADVLSASGVLATFRVANVGGVQVVTLFNKPVTGKIEIKKTGPVPTAHVEENGVTFEWSEIDETGISNVEYKITAAERIYSSSDPTVTVFEENDEVFTGKTNADGVLSVDKVMVDGQKIDLPLGKYTVEEISAPMGYTRKDDNRKTADLTAIYAENYNTATNGDNDENETDLFNEAVVSEVDYQNDRVKVDIGNFDNYVPDPLNTGGDPQAQLKGKTGIIKYWKNRKGETDKLANVKFVLYANEDIYDVNNHPLVYEGDKIAEAITDAEGRAKFEIDLPVGSYRIVEEETPAGYLPEDDEEDVVFDTTPYLENDTNNMIQIIRFTDDVYNKISETRIHLKDLDTKYDLADAKIKIVNEDDSPVTGLSFNDGNGNILSLDETYPDGAIPTWVTNDTGISIYGLKPGQTYKIVETQPRPDYTYNLYDENGVALGRNDKKNEYIFTVDDNVDIFEVYLYNKFVVGNLHITKTGEILKAIDVDEEHPFQYGSDILKDAEFTLYAAREIKHPDGSDTVLFNEGDVVKMHVRGEDIADAIVQTNEYGLAVMEGLYVGDYILKETTPPSEYLNIEDIPVTVSNDGYEKEVVDVIEDPISNTLQKVNIKVIKKDAVTQNPVKDAEYTLYSYSNIDTKGETIVLANKPIETVKTDENGEATFTYTIPAGYMYYIRETVSPSGYVLKDGEDDFVDVDAKYIGADVNIIEKEFTFIEEPIRVMIDLLDKDTLERLAGATITVSGDGVNKTIETSADANEMLSNLLENVSFKAGETYTITVTKPRQGYLNNVVTNNNYVSEYAENGYDVTSTKHINAIDIKLNEPVTNTVTFTVENTSDLQVITIFAQPVTADLKIKKVGDTANLEFTDESRKELVSITWDGEANLPNAEYTLITKNAIKHPDGISDDLYPAGTNIVEVLTGNEKLITGNDGTVQISGLPLGEYVLTEVKAPKGYSRTLSEVERDINISDIYNRDLYNSQVYDKNLTDDNMLEETYKNFHKTVDIGNDPDNPPGDPTPEENPNGDPNKHLKGEAAVYKLDEYDNGVAGAVFKLYADEDILDAFNKPIFLKNTLIATSDETDENGKATFEVDLPEGNYRVEEYKAPVGYHTTDKIVRFSCDPYKEDDEVQIIRFKDVINNKITKTLINVLDIDTKVELSEVVLQLKDEDGHIVQINGNDLATTDSDKDIYITGLEPGKRYTIEEITPRPGYLNGTVVNNTYQSEYAQNGYVIDDNPPIPAYDNYLYRDNYNTVGFVVKDDIGVQVVTIFNNRVNASIEITKKGDKSNVVFTDDSRQEVESITWDGETNLPNAEYTLITKEAIPHPDGVSDDLYPAGTNIVEVLTGKERLVTGEDGTVQISGLPLGKYTLTEVKAPKGYSRTMDEIERTIDIDETYLTELFDNEIYSENLTNENMIKEEYKNFHKTVDVGNDPENPPGDPAPPENTGGDPNKHLKGSAAVYKLDENDNGIAGAVFRMYADEDILDAFNKPIFLENTLVATSEESDETGKAVFNVDLPEGNYRVVEYKAPVGYHTTDKEVKFSCEPYKENDEVQIIRFKDTFNNEITKTLITVLDADTKIELSEVVLQLKDEEGNIVQVDGQDLMTTDNDKDIYITGLELGKRYTVEEITPRKGYLNEAVINNSYESEYAKNGYVIDDNPPIHAYDNYLYKENYNTISFVVKDDPGVQVVSIFNNSVTASIEITKKGDASNVVFTDDSRQEVESITWDGEAYLPNAEYTLITKDAIPHPDGVSDDLYPAGTNIVEALTGEEKLVTDKNGIAKISGLPLGKYILTEVKAPKGYSRTMSEIERIINIDETYLTELFDNEIYDENLTDENMIKEEYKNFHKTVDVGNDPENLPGDPTPTENTNGDPNKHLKGSAAVYKYDENGNGVAGAVFRMYADEDILDASNKPIFLENTLVATSEESDSNGKAVFNIDLPEGNYRVIEYKAPVGYHTTDKEVKFSCDPYRDDDEVQIIRFKDTFNNTITKTLINVLDIDTKNELSEVILQLRDEDGNIIQVDGKNIITTESNNNVLITGLELGKRYVVEEITPRNGYSNEAIIDNGYESEYAKHGYKKDEDPTIPAYDNYLYKENYNTISFIVKDDPGVQIVSIFNNRVKASIRITKKGEVPKANVYDKELQSLTYEVEGIPGAEYDIIPVNKIPNPDGEGYAVEEIEPVAHVVTDENGVAVADNLYIGNYIVRETKAPKGYSRARSKIQKDALIGDAYEAVFETPSEQYGNTIEIEVPYENPRQIVDVGQDFPDVEDPNLQGDPLSDNKYRTGVYKIGVDNGVEYGIARAILTLYAKEDIKDVFGEIIIPAGTKIESSMTGDDGRAIFETPIPVGIYVVKEEDAPTGYYLTNGEHVFDTSEFETNDEVQMIRLTGEIKDPITTVRIFLKDTVTKKELSDASIIVKDEQGRPIAATITVDTEGKGFIIKGLDPEKEYTIEEKYPRDRYTNIIRDENGKAIDGTNKYKFSFKDMAEGDDVPDEIVINLYNAYVTGKLTITKSGEVLESYDTEDGKLFGYTKEQLEGVKFELYAAEDIYHPDGVTGLLYKKNERVQMNTQSSNVQDAIAYTDVNGIAVMEGLYTGKYEVRETEVPAGYVKNNIREKVTIVPFDFTTQVVEAIEGLIEYSNNRQKINVTITKLDKDTKEPIEGAEFGLFAAADIYNNNKDFILGQDEMLGTAISTEDGTAVFGVDIPCASYYIKEIKAPDGYVATDERIEIDARWRADGRTNVNIKRNVYNEKTKVDVYKTIKDTDRALEGAKLAIYDEAKQEVETWITTGSYHRVEGLIPGRMYTLKEIQPADGYVTASPVTFMVKDRANDGDYEPQIIEMVDDPTIAVIRINEIDYDGTLSRLGEVRYHIEDESGEIVKIDGDPLMFVSNTKDDIVIERIPVGNYKIVLDNIPQGHVNPGVTEITVKDTPNKQHFNVNIPTIIIEIIAIDKDTGRVLPKVKIDLSTYDGTMLLDGEPLTLTEERIDAGRYIIHVSQGPSGYIPPEDKDITVKETSELQRFVVEMEHIKIRIKAVDEETGADIMNGVKVDIINKNGAVIEHDVPLTYAKEYLASGKYTIVVTEVPDGYVIPDEQDVYVRQTSDLQEFKIPIISVKASIRPIDAETNKAVKGVKIRLKAPDGTVYAIWKSDKGWKVFKPIKPGNYLIEVLKVPSGYMIPDIQPIKIENIGDMQYFEVELTKKQGTGGDLSSGGGPSAGSPSSSSAGTPVSKPGTGDNLDLTWLYIALGLLAVICGSFVLYKKRKKK